jgi:hypothetical protein
MRFKEFLKEAGRYIDHFSISSPNLTIAPKRHITVAIIHSKNENGIESAVELLMWQGKEYITDASISVNAVIGRSDAEKVLAMATKEIEGLERFEGALISDAFYRVLKKFAGPYFLDDLREETLLELGGRFKRTDQTWDEYTQWVYKKHKLSPLGSGGSARVFPHPTLPDIAVKVFLTADKNFVKFAEWCTENQDNPWLPKIYSVHNFKTEFSKTIGEYAKYSVMFMERLRPLTREEWDDFIEMSGLSLRRFGVGPIHQPKLARLIDELKKKKTDPKLLEVLEFLHANYQNYDFHYGNFMARGKQVVFIDPVGPPP